MIHSVQTGNRLTELPARESQLPTVADGPLYEANRLRARRRQVIIIGLLGISATALTAFGFAAHGVARPVRQHGTVLAGHASEALAGPIGPVVAGGQAVASRRVLLTSQVESVITSLPRRKGGALRVISFSVNGVVFSPDGKLVASADSDGTIRLWSLATGGLYGRVLQAGSSVNGVVFSPDGKLVASADSDGTIRLWSLATGGLYGRVLQAGSSVNGVVFSPDGKLVASADSDGTVRLWDPATGQPAGAPLPPAAA